MPLPLPPRVPAVPRPSSTARTVPPALPRDVADEMAAFLSAPDPTPPSGFAPRRPPATPGALAKLSDVHDVHIRVDLLTDAHEAHKRDTALKLQQFGQLFVDNRAHNDRNFEHLSGLAMAQTDKLTSIENTVNAMGSQFSNRHSSHSMAEEQLSGAITQLNKTFTNAVIELRSQVSLLFRALAWKGLVLTVALYMAARLATAFLRVVGL